MASSSIHPSRLTKPFSLAIFLVIVSCSTHYLMVAAGEVSTAGDDKAMRERYEKWMAEQGRTYKDSTEKARRFEVFKSNAHFIDSHNAATGPGGKSRPKLTTNKFADLTEDEFRNIYVTGHRVNYRPTSLVTDTVFKFGAVSLSDVPPSIDWRARGAVTSVKDQHLCACCWAFSSAAAVEGIHQITTGNQVSLSVQQLVDCSNAANEKCKAGEIDKAYEYIARSGGLVADQDYPYEGHSGTCRVYGKQAVARISGFQYVPARNETALLLAVAHQPVSVALDGGSRALRLIGTGIFGSAGEPCTTNLNHAMTIVGYGTDEHGTRYWLMKNSWGSDWGDKGYVKFARDVASEINGVCGLALEASYPVA